MKNILLIGLTLLLSLVIAAQPPARQTGEYNIANYGAIGDGTTLNTRAIQNTVDSCAKRGGGKIIIPPGKFVTGSIRLRSNINLYLEAGAVLIGSPDNKDYLHQKDFEFTGPGAGSRTGILFARDADHITIGGQGVIDGQGDLFVYKDSLQSGVDFDPKLTRQGADYRNPKFGREDGPVMWKGSYEERPGVMLIFSHCRNIRVEDVSINQSPNWTMAFMDCEGVQVRGLTIDNDMAIPNSDGIDMYDSKNVVVADCIIHSGDDAIAVISSDNVTAENCVLHSRSSGIRIGYNVFNQNNSGNLLFNNIRIYDSNRGVGIFQRQGGDMRNILFSNMVIQTRLHTGGWWGNGEPIHISAVPGLGSKKVGKITNVRFSHIIATGQSGLLFYGSKESALEDIVLDDVSLTITRGNLSDTYGGNIDLRPTNDLSLAIFSHKLPAIFGNEVKGLEIRNCTITLEGPLPPWITKGPECSNCTGVRINGNN